MLGVHLFENSMLGVLLNNLDSTLIKGVRIINNQSSYKDKNLKRLIIWSIIGAGISSVSVQLITIREFLSQFHGNEITISLVLFVWLVITGLGSLLAKNFKKGSITAYSILIILTSLWPLLHINLIRFLRESIFIHGAEVDFYEIFFYIIVTSSPYCLLVGFILPYALLVLKAHYSSLHQLNFILQTISGIFAVEFYSVLSLSIYFIHLRQ